MIKDIEEHETRIDQIQKRYDDQKYVVTIMGQQHRFAHTDIAFLLSLVKKQQSALETVLENMGNGEDSFAVVVEALKEE